MDNDDSNSSPTSSQYSAKEVEEEGEFENELAAAGQDIEKAKEKVKTIQSSHDTK